MPKTNETIENFYNHNSSKLTYDYIGINQEQNIQENDIPQFLQDSYNHGSSDITFDYLGCS